MTAMCCSHSKWPIMLHAEDVILDFRDDVVHAGQAGFVANISDIAPRHAGQLFGLCNTFGCLAAIAGVSTVGFVIQATGSFSAVFQLTAGLYVIGVLAWLSLCKGKPVFD